MYYDKNSLLFFLILGGTQHSNPWGAATQKGQEFGRFRFGGSDLIMLFQKPPTELYMFQNDPANEPIHFQYGQTAVYWNV